MSNKIRPSRPFENGGELYQEPEKAPLGRMKPFSNDPIIWGTALPDGQFLDCLGAVLRIVHIKDTRRIQGTERGGSDNKGD